MKIQELLNNTTLSTSEMQEGLGDRAHHQAVADARAARVMTWRKFMQKVKNSTMSDRDASAVLDEIQDSFGQALDSKVMKRHLQDLSNITNVDLDELEALADL